MNILFFLKPKSEVAYIYDTDTIRQTLEKMEFHQYSAVPIINKTGNYVGTITEGDILWAIKNDFSLNLQTAEDVQITRINRKLDNTPVFANSNIEDLISKSMNQNFVPVIDDNNIFIGIITRKDIIQYCYKNIKAKHC